METNNENPTPQTASDYDQQASPQIQDIENIEIITEPLNFSLIVSALLKRPLDLLATMEENHSLPWKPLMALSTLCLLIFGLVVGAFSGGTQFWAAPLKIVLGLGFGALICLPSLYIFSCLSGIRANFQTILGLLLCAIALLSLLLTGFAPVAWLFSTSSDSIAFFGFLCLALWLICLSFSFKLITKAALHLGIKSTHHLKVWMIVFTLVTLQLPTTLRPIIGNSDDLFHFNEKKFFIHHWLEQLNPS
ncbi:hypothetical protein [Rubritalea sp.]|uniref:hypothetical protein n=1 Tax=Rubritalea sp. TaxID=2109375 RepID=UPI003EF48183